MNQPLVCGVYAAWVVLIAVLFRAIGPRRAAAVGVLGGMIALPQVGIHVDPNSMVHLDKRLVGGIALLVGVLVADRRAFGRFQPNWLDLPMGLYLADALAGLGFGSFKATCDAVNLLLERGIGWGVPYWVGRVYFADADGPGRVGRAIAWAGVLYIPICLYEGFAGPTRYLAGLLYGIDAHYTTAERLGGWRPEGFMESGLELACWMALTAVTATWMAVGNFWRPRPILGWIVASALILTTIACRGVYGYLVLLTGLLAIGLTLGLRSRIPLVALVTLGLAYMGLRLTGVWNGDALVDLAARVVGRPGTVAIRLGAEDLLLGRVLGQVPLFGFGFYIWHEEGLSYWPDGWWLHQLWMAGLVGLVLHVAALCVVPIGVTLARPPGRPTRAQAADPSWGLALFLVLFLLDGLHNTSYLAPVAWVGGTLVGQAVRARRGVGSGKVAPS